MTKPTTIIHDTIIVRDTIYQTITATKIDKAEIYKDILTQQTQTYNIILGGFLAILACFATVTYLYNTRLAKRQIIKQTNKIFEEQKAVILTHIRKEVDIELYILRAESARLFALRITGNTIPNKVNRFYWWMQCLKYSLLAKKGKATRLSCECAINAGIQGLVNQAQFKSDILLRYPKNKEKFEALLEELPSELDKEKKQLQSIISKIYF
ncbi:hypothetical protein AAYQ05_13580 [Flavobacterium sp. B11]|uniref:hypothetical protein n=1 Tax=Flavobacterium movens TaxID=214860 RepID=UPI0031E2D53A